MRNKNKFKVQLGSYTFYISLFCFQKIGDTENMKFRLECEQNKDFSREFDDYESMNEYLNKFLQEEVFDFMVMSV